MKLKNYLPAKLTNFNRTNNAINSAFKPSLVKKHTRIKAYKTLVRPISMYGMTNSALL